jgi:phosphoribosylaminoimidazolecarboxamide formyltransferase/IMP cyclohydrolase
MEQNLMLAPVKCAIISLTDKSGLKELGQGLKEFGVKMISTGGTAKALRDSGLSITEVSDYTGSPEMLGGRVKTLHPKVHGGILNIRSNPEHQATIKEHGIEDISLVICNLYEFEKTIAQADITPEQAIESIDIGGVTLIRAAYKCFHDVTIIVDPADYPALLAEMKNNNGATTLDFRTKMAAKASNITAKYESAIAGYFNKLAAL